MSHTPPVDSKGAAIREQLEKLEVPNLIIMLEEGQQITTGHLVEKTIDEILALLAQEVNKAQAEITEILDKYNVPEYDPAPINKSRYGLMCNELRKAGLV